MRTSEIFSLTVQGEGQKIFVPSTFVRLAGCNLAGKCENCDSKYAQRGDIHLTPEEVFERIEQFPCKEVVITGGEPLVQIKEVTELVGLLLRNKYFITIETNCTIKPSKELKEMNILWSISPKLKGMGKDVWFSEAALKEFKKLDHYFKFVIVNESDLLEFKKVAKKYKLDNEVVYLQPDGVCNKLDEYAIRYRWLVERVVNDSSINQQNIRCGLQAHRIAFDQARGR